MITKIEINGFKTFENFEVTLTPFVTIAGVNGSGKSNLFDAMRLISDLAHKDLKTAFAEQRGNFLELFTQHSSAIHVNRMSFAFELFLDRKIKDEFNKEVELSHQRLRYELKIVRKKDNKLGLERLFVEYESLRPIKRGSDKWVKQTLESDEWENAKKSHNYKPYIATEEADSIKRINLRQDGIRGGKPTPIKDLERTVLSGVNDASFPHAYAVRAEMLNWRLLQLNPVELGKPSSMLGADRLDFEGRNLAGLIKRIAATEKMALESISRNVHTLLPEIKRVFIDDDTARQQYVLMVESADGRTFSSNVLSEGTLRIIALVALTHDDRHKGLICFEEPENGIHPYRMKNILAVLHDLSTNFQEEDSFELPLRQVLINTHSPLLLKEVYSNPKFDNTLIYFARLVSKVDHQSKGSYRLTRLSAVKKNSAPRLLLDTIAAEDTLSHSELLEYLSSYDSDHTAQNTI